MRCGSSTANSGIFSCILQHSCCNRLKNLTQHAQSFLVFAHARTHARTQWKKVVPLSLPYKKKNYTYIKTNNSRNPKELPIYLSMFRNASKYNTVKPTDIHRLDPAEVNKVIGLSLLHLLPSKNKQFDQNDYFFVCFVFKPTWRLDLIGNWKFEVSLGESSEIEFKMQRGGRRFRTVVLLFLLVV